MRTLNRFIARCRNLVTGVHADQRLKEEMEGHIALQTEENVRAGMSPSEARRQAVLKFGSMGGGCGNLPCGAGTAIY